MKIKTEWLKIMGLGLSLSSTILVCAWGVMKLADLGFIRRDVGFLIFVLIIISTFLAMIYNAYSKKN